jgi:hypothetical protein
MRAAAAGANIAGGVDDLLARQMIRQRLTYRLAPLRAWPVGDGCCMSSGFGFFKVFQPQFQLMNLRVERLGGLAELHPA